MLVVKSGASRQRQLTISGLFWGVEEPIRIVGVEVIGNHVTEAQLPLATEHELEPFPHQLLRHEEASGKAIGLSFCRCTWCLQMTAVKSAVAVHDSVFVEHKVADLMRAGEELDFVTKLSRDGNLVRLTVNQRRDTSTGVVPIELGVSLGGMLMVVVAAAHGSDPGAAHHHPRNILIWPQVTAITVNLQGNVLI